MPTFKAIGVSVSAPKEGVSNDTIKARVNFMQADAGRPDQLVDTRDFIATSVADLRRQLNAVLKTLKDRSEHAKQTAGIVGVTLAEVSTS